MQYLNTHDLKKIKRRWYVNVLNLRQNTKLSNILIFCDGKFRRVTLPSNDIHFRIWLIIFKAQQTCTCAMCGQIISTRERNTVRFADGKKQRLTIVTAYKTIGSLMIFAVARIVKINKKNQLLLYKDRIAHKRVLQNTR